MARFTEDSPLWQSLSGRPEHNDHADLMAQFGCVANCNAGMARQRAQSQLTSRRDRGWPRHGRTVVGAMVWVLGSVRRIM